MNTLQKTILNGKQLEAILLTGIRNLLLDKKVSFTDGDKDKIEGIVKNICASYSGLVLEVEDAEGLFDAELTRLKAEVEALVMKLAACGVAAQSNTQESFDKNLLAPDNKYYSASYSDVLQCVQHEMSLRAEVERLETQIANWTCSECSWHSTADNIHVERMVVERKRIAEAVRNINIVTYHDCLDGTTDILPDYQSVKNLADRIERGEFAQKGGE